MAFIHTYLCWFIFITSSAAELKPPTNVTISISGNNVTVTWTLPGKSERFTLLEFYSHGRREKLKYIMTPQSSYTITLTSCKKYTLDMQCAYLNDRRSKKMKKTFWVTNNIFYASINTDINISWTTTIGQFYHVLAPSNIIYTVIGDIVPNTDMNKYKINSKGTEKIDISVLNVSQNDSGIYQSVDSSFSPDGCCLLIITDKPRTPTIAVNKHPFVGDEIEFTCTYQVQRWPVELSSSLTYTFSVDDAQEHNTLKINVTISDKGKQVYCNAMDDRRDVSNVSNVIVLDPYYGPNKPVLSPWAKSVNITEGSKLGPIVCSAECHPNCNYVWKYRRRTYDRFSYIRSLQSLEIYNITRTQSGIYRCRVNHPNDTSRCNKTDVIVTVHYPPSDMRLELGKDSSGFTEYRRSYMLDEDQQVHLRMYIDSVPKPRIAFYSHDFPKTPLMYNTSGKYYTATLPVLKCENSGNHTIEVDNGIKDGVRKNINLVVQCKPKQIKVARRTIGAQMNYITNITVQLVSYPKPTAEWRTHTGRDWTVQQDGVHYKYILTSSIEVKDKSDFKLYMLNIMNNLGSVDLNITLIPQDKPQPPTNLSFVDISFNRANLSWIPGFDGGEAQSFSVNVLNEEGAIINTFKVNGETQKDATIYLTLTQLHPDTSYDVEVVATNSFGTSKTSLKLMTVVPPQTPPNFSLVSSTETSILVEWTPGYSDDHEQTFYLEYRARRTETWSLKEISHNTKQLTSLTYVLSGLQDSTLYELKMYSKNKFGRSLSTEIDIIQTREKQEKASGCYAVIGGMAGVIAVLVIIVIILKRKTGCSSGARNNISNRSDNIDEMFSPNRTTNDMYEEIRKGSSGTRNEDLQQRGGNTSTTTCEMLAMQDIPNTYGDISSEQEQRQSESTTEQYETLGEQDKPNVYEEIKNKEEPEDREYINLQL